MSPPVRCLSCVRDRLRLRLVWAALGGLILEYSSTGRREEGHAPRAMAQTAPPAYPAPLFCTRIRFFNSGEVSFSGGEDTINGFSCQRWNTGRGRCDHGRKCKQNRGNGKRYRRPGKRACKGFSRQFDPGNILTGERWLIYGCDNHQRSHCTNYDRIDKRLQKTDKPKHSRIYKQVFQESQSKVLKRTVGCPVLAIRYGLNPEWQHRMTSLWTAMNAHADYKGKEEKTKQRYLQAIGEAARFLDRYPCARVASLGIVNGRNPVKVEQLITQHTAVWKAHCIEEEPMYGGQSQTLAQWLSNMKKLVDMTPFYFRTAMKEDNEASDEDMDSEDEPAGVSLSGPKNEGVGVGVGVDSGSESDSDSEFDFKDSDEE